MEVKERPVSRWILSDPRGDAFAMPSLQSQLFNRFAANRVKRLFADFELKSARRELALQDWLVSARPRDVDIQRISLRQTFIV
jgi:hypothetical protein